MRGISTITGKDISINYIQERIRKDESILDVGFGAGYYGRSLKYLGYNNIDGIDVYEDDIEELNLDNTYNNIYIENIIDFNFKHYDMIIMGDILEHLKLEDAQKLLSKWKKEKRYKHILISVPYEFMQNGTDKNPFEKHLQSEITVKYMSDNYPHLKLIYLNKMEDFKKYIGIYIHENP